jgi:phosphoribosyl-ATP pyrophosphohydrolase
MADSLAQLYASVLEARARDPASSRTSKLFSNGVAKMAKKLAEEAVEVGLDAVQKHNDNVVLESVDLLYHLCVIWAECNVTPDDVAAEITRRERLYGAIEKLPKKQAARVPTDKVAFLRPRRNKAERH